MPADLAIRPARASDLADYLALARLTGPGFTSLPEDEALLAARIAASEAAFAGGDGVYLLMLEDTRAGRVVGCAAVKPGGKPRSNFVNFRVEYDAHGAPAAITPTDAYADVTEVGSLFLHPDYRKGGVGRWLAQTRYLVIAAAPARFGETIFAELRGVVDAADRSPFYDEIGAEMFGMTFVAADRLCATGGDEALIRRLRPETVSLSNLSAAARDALGKTHKDGEGASALLEWEGFAWAGVIDLLDGGPLVEAPLSRIRTIRESLLLETVAGDPGAQAALSILATPELAHFRSVRAPCAIRDGAAILAQAGLDALGLSAGAPVRVSARTAGSHRERS